MKLSRWRLFSQLPLQNTPEQWCQCDGFSAVTMSQLLQLRWSNFIKALETMRAEQLYVASGLSLRISGASSSWANGFRKLQVYP
jgi:hypothetical protein